jgi:hypothetical protein
MKASTQTDSDFVFAGLSTPEAESAKAVAAAKKPGLVELSQRAFNEVLAAPYCSTGEPPASLPMPTLDE